MPLELYITIRSDVEAAYIVENLDNTLSVEFKRSNAFQLDDFLHA